MRAGEVGLAPVRTGEIGYPASLPLWLGPQAPPCLWLLGNPTLLAQPLTAFFTSSRIPGRLILAAYDLAQRWRDEERPVIGGFHSPIEHSVLSILLRGASPIVICPARGLVGKRTPVAWRAGLEAGRLLLVSPFGASVHRPTEETAHHRNEVVAALAAQVVVAHATPGGKTEAFCRTIIGWGKPVLTFSSAANQNLLAMGAQVIETPRQAE